MDYPEEERLQLSGLQHFAFCRRQWALIHIECLWADNLRTVDGSLMHERAHDSGSDETRGDLLIRRGVRVFSARLGVSGECDVLEFRRGSSGIPVKSREGLWQPYPVEYKRGSPKEHDADELQLCCQALCLEEMLCCEVPKGALFYGQPHRRREIEFSKELRSRVAESLEEMHQLYSRGYTPKVKPSKSCGACSIKELCLPALLKPRLAASYLLSHLEDEI